MAKEGEDREVGERRGFAGSGGGMGTIWLLVWGGGL